MSLVRMFDAAFPPAQPYPGCGAVAGYIGGNTPHVWSGEEWRRFSGLYQLPIWVAAGASGTAQAQAEAAADTARALGWTAFRPGAWRAIVLDMEAQSDEAFVLAFGTELRARGYRCWPYMSLTALPSDPPGYQVWLALWNGVATVPAIHDVIAHQYAPDVAWDDTAVDLSVVDSAALDGFGVGPRA